MTRVKICGLTREADVRAAVDAGADAVGIISGVSVDTPREVDAAAAAELAARVPPFVAATLVTMPETPAEAVSLARSLGPDVLQLHADFDAEELGFVRAETATKIVPVVGCDERDRARELDEAADALLVDSTDGAGAGGTGETHDWEATRALARDLDSPVVLAGGLTPANVADAVRAVEPFAVDVASGVEAEGGVKDHDAVTAFVRRARAAGAEVPAP